MSTTTYKVKFEFTDEDSKTAIFTINNAKPGITDQDVQTAAQAIITNGSFFKQVPVTLVSAWYEETVITPFDTTP